MLSGTATVTNKLVKLISQYKTKLLDTRKTIPGFRLAQNMQLGVVVVLTIVLVYLMLI